MILFVIVLCLYMFFIGFFKVVIKNKMNQKTHLGWKAWFWILWIPSYYVLKILDDIVRSIK